MGTRGTGRFGDYREGNEAGEGSGLEVDDRCNEVFNSILEEIERCQYYQDHGNPPPVGTDVVVSQGKRLYVSAESGEEIGYLPTKYNYLAACIASGFSYAGSITISNTEPIVRVEVQIMPTP